jgi:hypothetical protein
MSESPVPLEYASPHDPPLRDRNIAMPVFFTGWGIGVVVVFACTIMMCGGEIWLPFELAFPHAAVAAELFEPPSPGPANPVLLLALLAAPMTHGAYAVLFRRRSRLGLGIAAALHMICLAWSLHLRDPFLT